MISKSRTIIKIIIFLIINGAIVDESQAFQKSTTREGPSASPLASPVHEEPKLTPQYIKFLKACDRRLSEECADQIFHYILKTKNVSRQCCSTLVYMGPDCHKALIEREKDTIKNSAKKRKLVSRSEDLWKKCEKTSPESKDKNYPRLPAPEYRPRYQQFLEECAKKFTEKCGTEVVGAIFKTNKTVDKDCCIKLFKMGKDCYDEMVKNVQKLASYTKDPREVKEKSGQVWKHCKGLAGRK